MNIPVWFLRILRIPIYELKMKIYTKFWQQKPNKIFLFQCETNSLCLRNQLDYMQFRMILMQMNKDRFVNYAAVSQYNCQLTILIRLGHNSLGSVTLDGLKMSHSYLMLSGFMLDTISIITFSLFVTWNKENAKTRLILKNSIFNGKQTYVIDCD